MSSSAVNPRLTVAHRSIAKLGAELCQAAPALCAVVASEAGQTVRPLAIGIRSLLGADEEAGRLLAAYCRSRRYLRALAAPGSCRHGLDGEAIEPVSDEHRVRAQQKIDRQKQIEAFHHARLVTLPSWEWEQKKTVAAKIMRKGSAILVRALSSRKRLFLASIDGEDLGVVCDGRGRRVLALVRPDPVSTLSHPERRSVEWFGEIIDMDAVLDKVAAGEFSEETTFEDGRSRVEVEIGGRALCAVIEKTSVVTVFPTKRAGRVRKPKRSRDKTGRRPPPVEPLAELERELMV